MDIERCCTTCSEATSHANAGVMAALSFETQTNLATQHEDVQRSDMPVNLAI